MRMGMAATRDRDACAKIKIAFTLRREHARALATIETYFRSGIGREDGGDHDVALLGKIKSARRNGERLH